MISIIKAVLFAKHKDVKLLRAVLATTLPIINLWMPFVIGSQIAIMESWYGFPYIITCIAIFMASMTAAMWAWFEYDDHG